MPKQTKLLFLGWSCFLLSGFIYVVMCLTATPYNKTKAVTSDTTASITMINVDIEVYYNQEQQNEPEPVPGIITEITAYNVGDPYQTDSTPCIGADGSDMCQRIKNGEKLIASNSHPFGTKLSIKGLGIYTVTDRMNSRYKTRLDIAMPLEEKAQAIQWGLKRLEVSIIE